MNRIVFSRLAEHSLRSMQPGKDRDRLRTIIRDIASDPLSGPNTKPLIHIPHGYRRRAGRFRILYTIHTDEKLVRIWIVDREKDTKKDYQRWTEYILRQQKS